MTKYDSSFIPPAPIVKVEVANPYRNSSRKVLGIIDSGAGISVIPCELLSKLGLKAAGSIQTRGFNQRIPEKRTTYRVNLSFENCTFETVEVVLTPHSFVLIGRDILNQLKIVLDGKNLQFQVIRY